MDEKMAVNKIEAEEEQPMQERFCEVSAEEIANFAAESDGSREALIRLAHGFVP